MSNEDDDEDDGFELQMPLVLIAWFLVMGGWKTLEMFAWLFHLIGGK